MGVQVGVKVKVGVYERITFSVAVGANVEVLLGVGVGVQKVRAAVPATAPVQTLAFPMVAVTTTWLKGPPAGMFTELVATYPLTFVLNE